MPLVFFPLIFVEKEFDRFMNRIRIASTDPSLGLMTYVKIANTYDDYLSINSHFIKTMLSFTPSLLKYDLLATEEYSKIKKFSVGVKRQPDCYFIIDISCYHLASSLFLHGL